MVKSIASQDDNGKDGDIKGTASGNGNKWGNSEDIISNIFSTNDPTFSSNLVKLCNEHKIPEALKEVLDDYETNGLLITKYKAGLLKLFNTPGEYYNKMVEDDITASGMTVAEAAHCRTVMANCITRIHGIV